MAKVIAKNKDAFFNYELIETFEAGIVLAGWEVKSIRAGKVDLKGAFCYFKDNELYVSNMHVNLYMDVKGDERQMRKLLLSKHELKKLRNEKEAKGLAIVPTVLKWSAKGFVKLDIALAKGKTKFDKREVIKARDEKRLNGRYLKTGV